MAKSSALHSGSVDAIKQKIVAMERSALERWSNGDPDGFLELSADDVVYFDPFQDRRLNGHAELKQLYDGFRGTVHIDRNEMLDPQVQCTESVAVLTFNLVSYQKEKVSRWNCTEVYRLEPDGQWKIIQTHWSFTKPNLQFD